jgi:2-polyprenyl-3-methyl-5-hydroxy-6-metoxy-1,4-benzoquinol methylase
MNLAGPATCPVCNESRTHPFQSIWPVPLRSCDACKARFVWPLPTDDELRRRYEREHESGKWSKLVDLGDPLESRRRAALLTRLAVPPTGRILDVGFGDGRFLDAVAEMGWTAVGLEISTDAATKVAHRHPVAVGAIDAVAEDASLDAVTFWDVLEHVPNPAALLQAATARLRVGGLAAATMPSAASFTARIEAERWRYYDLGTYGHLVHMTPRHLRMLFAQAGLDVVRVETTGSVDLRHSVGSGGRRFTGIAAGVLDKLSGALARLAEPLGYGNTLLVIGRRGTEDPSSSDGFGGAS